MSDNDNEFPVLKDVVTPGDESIIRTSRLGHEVIREIEELEQKTNTLSPADLSRHIAMQEVDALIDEIVERHANAMRAELKEILARLVVRERRGS